MFEKNLIRIKDLDSPLHRIFRLNHLREAMRQRELVLVRPSMWDDPFENPLTSFCTWTVSDQQPWKQEFFAHLRKPIHAQCWSSVEESDTLWRVYSRYVKDEATFRNKCPEDEGVQVRTTPRKLFRSLWDYCQSDPQESCFLGRVVYLKKDQVAQYITNEIGHNRLLAFDGGLGHAESVLYKRSAFSHEAETRLIHVDHRQDQVPDDLLRVPIDPNDLFDEIIFEPRLVKFERLEREEEIRKLGYTGKIGVSDLYQRVFHQVVLS